jgi:hypothetical protein
MGRRISSEDEVAMASGGWRRMLELIRSRAALRAGAPRGRQY